MKIKVNGDLQEIPDGLTVSGLLDHLGMPTNRVAVERNLEILPRAQWTETRVAASDSYEIVHFVGGGVA
jgi:sulfur carrier protein